MMSEEQVKTMVNLAKRQGYIAGQRDVAAMIEGRIKEFGDASADEVLIGLALALKECADEEEAGLKKEIAAFEEEIQKEVEKE